MPAFSVPIKQTGQARFYSQSAAVSNTILDWAQQREMGSTLSRWAIARILITVNCWTIWHATARPALLYLEQLKRPAVLFPPPVALHVTNHSGD